MVRRCLPLLLFCLVFYFTKAQNTKLFLVAGQSNAVGVGNADSSGIYSDPLCFEYKTTDDQLHILKDPVGYNTATEDFQAAVTGSAWPAFAYSYHHLTGDSVIIVQAAKGATACHPAADAGAGNWSDSYHLFSQAIAKARAAETFTGIPLSGIIWLQGESDAIAIQQDKITQCQYESAFQDLIQRFRNSLRCDLPFYIIQTGLYLTVSDTGFWQVRNMQKLVDDKDPLAFVVDSTTYRFRSAGLMRSDSIHYCQSALNEMGISVAENIIDIERHVKLDTCYTAPAQPVSPEWAVFPSPFKDELTIEVLNFSCADMDIKIVDMLGRICLKTTQSCMDAAPLRAHLNTTGLAKGVYVVRVTLNKQWTLKQKLVKD